MQIIKLHITAEDDETDNVRTLVIATVDTEGYVELTSFIENDEVAIDILYDIAEFMEENLDLNERNMLCH